MKIKKRSSEFRGRNWCAKAREYDELSLSSPKNGNYDNAIIVKDIIRGYLKGEYQIDEFPDLVDQGIEDNYLTDKEGEARRNKLVKLLTRACRSEKRKASFPLKKDLEFEDYIVSVKPDAVFDDGFNLEVVLYRAGKPDVTMKGKKVDGSVDQCLELYFLLAYGKTLVPQGQSRSVRGSYYFLRKTTDSTYGQWDNDFFSDKGGNVVYLEDMHMGGSDMQTGIDLHFKDLLDKYYTGRECTEEECKRCCWNAACNYVKSPELYEKKENRKNGAIIPSDPQQAIIDFRKGIARVNAAAGSGKTECVTERGARMITEDHVAPGEMLFLTFTDAAAREMKERIAKKCTARGVNTSMDDFEAMTFNTFAYRIVRDKYLDCGFTAPPLVIDSVRNSVIITQILQDHPVAGLDYLNYSMDMPNCRGALPCTAKVFEIIKTEDLDPDKPETVGLVQDGMREAGMSRFVSMTAYPELVNLYKDYDRRLKEENLLQFADQEPLMRRVLDLYPDYLEQYGYKHIIVDEFQDSNDVQLDTIQRLTKCGTFESLMVVGDDSQSIYGFRHTSPENILHFFQKIGKTGNDLFLVENRRSTPEILELANKINALNKNRVDKDMIPVRESGKKPVTRGFHTKAEEYEYIGENIQKLISGGTLPEDIAFIAFKKTELIAMGAELSRRGIPWVLKNPLPLMENSRVNAAIGLAEAFYQPDADQLYFNYLTVKYDGSIFDNSIAEIQAQVQEMKKQFMDMDLLDIHYQRKIFHDLLEDIRGTDEIYAYFLDLIYQNEDLQSELEYIQNFKRFGEKTCKKMEQTYRGVVLITAHSSKGLEWPVVFNSITNYDSKALHTSSSRSDKVEEMRRLLFVSMTRARDLLWVTGQYVCYGKKDDQTYNQFLKEVMEANGDAYIPVDASAALRELDRKQKAARRRERQHAPTEEQKKAYAEITRGAKQMNLMDMLNAMAASR